MATTFPVQLKIEESALRNSVIIQAGREIRVREYIVREVNNQPIKAHYLIGLSTVVAESPVPAIPQVGDIFDANPTFGVAALQTRDGNAEPVPGHRHVCQRVTFSQVQPTMIKVVAFFADDETDWKVHRSIEIGVKDTVLHYDLDALHGRFNLQSPDAYPLTIGGCKTFHGKIWEGFDPSVPGGPQTPTVNLQDALINGTEGVRVPFPTYTLVVEGMYHDMLFTLQQASEDVGTTNAFATHPGHPVFGGGDPDTWLFAGVTGTEIKSVSNDLGVAARDIWRLTWKFQYDVNRHRQVRAEKELGNLFDLVNLGAPGEPWPCRSSRVIGSEHWHNWIDKAVF